MLTREDTHCHIFGETNSFTTSNRNPASRNRVSAFEDVDRFKERVDAAIRQVHAAKRAPGVDRLYVPGEKEYLTRNAYEREGITTLRFASGAGRRSSARRVTSRAGRIGKPVGD